MHDQARAYVERTLRALPPPERVLELGSRSINGGVRDLLPKGCTYLGIDELPGPGVDVIADAATFVPPWPPDLVLLCEVLEHTPKGSAILANVARMLAPGGHLIVTCAGIGRAEHSTVDGGERLYPGEWYAGVLREWLEDWLQPFLTFEIEEDSEHGDLYANACGAL